MAASGDDNKFRIVAEGGLEVLIRMALSKDEATQEHAVEAIAELVTVPAIQVYYSHCTRYTGILLSLYPLYRYTTPTVPTIQVY